MTTAAKHTAGPCIASGKIHEVEGNRLWSGWVRPVVPVGGYRGAIASIQSCAHIGGISNEEAEANAHFIAEAFTVAHETGLTPRQLAEQRDELLVALQEAEAVLTSLDRSGYSQADLLSTVRAALAKAEGGTHA